MKFVTETGQQIAVIFNKHELIAMKEGKVLNANVMMDGKTRQLAFMRESTFERSQASHRRAQMIQNSEPKVTEPIEESSSKPD